MPKNSQFIPPALPPKKQKLSSSNVSLNNIIITPPISPKVSNINELVHDEKQQNNEKETSSADDSRNEKIVNEDSRKEENDVVLRKKPNDMVELENFKLSLILIFHLQKPLNLMEELDVQEYLIFKKDGDDGPMVLIGGRSDALIIHATKNTTQKSGEGSAEQSL